MKDLAAEAAKVIGEREAHYYAIYSLASTGPQSYNDVAATVGRVLGKKVRVEQRPFQEAVDAFLAVVAPKEGPHSPVRVAAERMLLYNHNGLLNNKGVTEWLLGRKGQTWEDVAREALSSNGSK